MPALKASKTDYLTFEVRFIWCCLNAILQDSKIMTFDKHQREALLGLHSCLNEKASSYNKQKATSAMYSALKTLYFPDDPTLLALDSFNSPFICFLALICLDRKGGYRSIWDIPPMLSKAQFSMRLRASRFLKQNLDEWVLRHTKGVEQSPWFEYVSQQL